MVFSTLSAFFERADDMKIGVLIPLAAALSAVHGGTAPTYEPISFKDDVLPVLSKAGCNGSGCHSKPGGQNGFQLSVFAYDPEADYREIVHESRGRRLSPGAPDQSLILLKGTQAVPHEGGRRFELDSDAYHTLYQWIENGAPYIHPDDAELTKITLSPDRLETRKNGEHALSRDRALCQWQGTRGHTPRAF